MNKKSIKSDLKHVDKVKDQNIDYSDIPELDESFFSKAMVQWLPAKKQLTLRFDEDVLEWLKNKAKAIRPKLIQFYGRTMRRIKTILIHASNSMQF